MILRARQFFSTLRRHSESYSDEEAGRMRDLDTALDRTAGKKISERFIVSSDSEHRANLTEISDLDAKKRTGNSVNLH